MNEEEKTILHNEIYHINSQISLLSQFTDINTILCVINELEEINRNLRKLTK